MTPVQELTAALKAHGVDEVMAARVAEAADRRTKARERQQVFYYADIEYKLESIYSEVGASPELIEDVKVKIWGAARDTADHTGCSIEEALFFCFHEAVDMQHEFLKIRSVIASHDSVDVHEANQAQNL
jgi:hypothetical protein